MKSLTELEIREILQAGKDAFDPTRTLVGNMSPYRSQSIEAELFHVAYFHASLCDLVDEANERLRLKTEQVRRFQSVTGTLKELLTVLETVQSEDDCLG